MKNLIVNLKILKNSIFYASFKKVFLQVLVLWFFFAIFEGAGISLLYPVAEYIQFGTIQTKNYITRVLDLVSNFNIEINIYSLLCISLIILSFRFFFYFKKNVVTFKSVYILENLIRNTLINTLYHSNISFFIKKKEGEWLSSFSYDLVRARSVVSDVSQIFGNIFLIIFYFLILCVVSLDLVIFSFPIFLLTLLILKKKSGKFEILGKKISEESTNYMTTHEDVTKNIIFVKMKGLVKFFQNKLEKQSLKITSYQDQIMRQNFKIDSYFSFLLLLGIFYIILISKLKLDLSFFQTAIFLFVLSRIAPCLQSLVRAALNFLVNIQSLKKIIELDQSAKKFRENLHGKIEIKGKINRIKFNNVCFNYSNKSKKTLDNLNFEIKKGESLGIIGPSGAGKTTILNLLTNFYRPTSGKIIVNDFDLNNLNNILFRKNISYLPQNPELFNDTIRNNLLMGLKKKYTDRSLIKILNDCYCEFISDLPNKLDSVVGDRGLLLSGGQRQRLVIARAVINKSNIIILDEATTGLDDYSEKKTLETLKKIKKNTIQIISSHRINTVKNTDKILYINKENNYLFGKTHILIKQKTIKKFFNK